VTLSLMLCDSRQVSCSGISVPSCCLILRTWQELRTQRITQIVRTQDADGHLHPQWLDEGHLNLTWKLYRERTMCMAWAARVNPGEPVCCNAERVCAVGKCRIRGRRGQMCLHRVEGECRNLLVLPPPIDRTQWQALR